MARDPLDDVLSRAVEDLLEHGYDSAERVEYWMREIKTAAGRSSVSAQRADELLRERLAAVYRREVEGGRLADRHPGVRRFGVERVRPQLRAELDRRIAAAANLIKLNREERVEQTLRRFSGWATSVPKGGTDAASRRKVREQIKKPLVRRSFEERRVLIDQGAKLQSSLSSILAVDGGAIAGVWRHIHQRSGYQPRPEHVARDGTVFTIPENWALERGLMRPGKAGYTTDVEQPAELPFCQCYYRYVYSLSSLPDEMVTRKGREALAEARRRMEAA